MNKKQRLAIIHLLAEQSRATETGSLARLMTKLERAELRLAGAQAGARVAAAWVASRRGLRG